MTGRKVRVYVRSKVVPDRVVNVKTTAFSLSGKLVCNESKKVLHARVLDQETQKAVESAKELAGLSGLPLEVVDISRRNVIRRIVGRLSEPTEAHTVTMPADRLSRIIVIVKRHGSPELGLTPPSARRLVPHSGKMSSGIITPTTQLGLSTTS